VKKSSETLRDLEANAMHVVQSDDPDASIFGGRRFFDDGRPLFRTSPNTAWALRQRLKQWRQQRR